MKGKGDREEVGTGTRDMIFNEPNERTECCDVKLKLSSEVIE